MGSLWIVVDSCGVVVDRCGSLWIVVGHCGSLWVVPGFSNYVSVSSLLSLILSKCGKLPFLWLKGGNNY